MNNFLMQFQSDIMNSVVERPELLETTALGAALIAGYQIGLYNSLHSISKKWRIDRKFTPKMRKRQRISLLKGWQQAIKRTLV